MTDHIIMIDHDKHNVIYKMSHFNITVVETTFKFGVRKPTYIESTWINQLTFLQFCTFHLVAPSDPRTNVAARIRLVVKGGYIDTLSVFARDVSFEQTDYKYNVNF